MTSIVTFNGLANIVSAWVAFATDAHFLQWGVGSGQTRSSNVVNSTTTTTEARATGTTSAQTTTNAGDTYRVVGTLTAAGARVITECGVFDAAGAASPPTGGNMDLYGDFAAINLATGDSITFTFNVQFT